MGTWDSDRAGEPPQPGYPPQGGPGYGQPPQPGYPPPGGPGPQGPPGGGSKKGLWIGLSAGVGVVVVIAAVAVALRAHHGGPTGSAASGSRSGAPSTSASAGPPLVSGGPTLTGDQLQPLLPGSGELPGGWTVMNRVPNSGGTNYPPDPGMSPLSHTPCSDLPTLSSSDLMFDYEMSFAGEDLKDGDQLPRIHIGGFSRKDLAKQLQEIKVLAARCSRFGGNDPSGNHVSWTAGVYPVTVPGANQAMVLKVTAPGYLGDYVLLAQFGNTLVGIDNAYDPAAPSYTQTASAFTGLAAKIGQQIAQEVKGQKAG